MFLVHLALKALHFGLHILPSRPSLYDTASQPTPARDTRGAS
jgi:hypothetical protein